MAYYIKYTGIYKRFVYVHQNLINALNKDFHFILLHDKTWILLQNIAAADTIIYLN